MRNLFCATQKNHVSITLQIIVFQKKAFISNAIQPMIQMFIVVTKYYKYSRDIILNTLWVQIEGRLT